MRVSTRAAMSPRRRSSAIRPAMIRWAGSRNVRFGARSSRLRFAIAWRRRSSSRINGRSDGLETEEMNIRQYATEAQSTDTFGRVLCTARDQHFVIDGPVQNGCPGEAVTPPEAFLTGVAACGVELEQLIARELSLPIPTARVHIEGII